MKQLDSLLDMYKSTQDVLPKQAEQEMAFKKCRNKVHCMTDEMKTLQRITTEDATPKQVCNRLAWTNDSTVKFNSFSYCLNRYHWSAP